MKSCAFVQASTTWVKRRTRHHTVSTNRLNPHIHLKKRAQPTATLPPEGNFEHPPKKPSLPDVLWRAPPTIAYILYMNHLFLQSPTGAISVQDSLQQALQLSLNFCYVTPIMLPQLAPTLHPILEGIFNVVVAWALLLFGFLSEDNPPRKSSIPAQPFLIATAFLTNIFYLPYLILRAKPTDKVLAPSSSLQKLGESIFLPIFSLSLLGASTLWAVFARPDYGDLASRISSFKNVLSSNILAYSFGVDVLTFSLFQSWLVGDDANRRTWRSESVKRTATRSALVPFFGLAFYLIQRARHTTLPEN